MDRHSIRKGGLGHVTQFYHSGHAVGRVDHPGHGEKVGQMLILEKAESSRSSGTLGEVAGEALPHLVLVGQLGRGEEDEWTGFADGQPGICTDSVQLIQRATCATYLVGSLGAGLRAKSKSNPIFATFWLCPLSMFCNLSKHQFSHLYNGDIMPTSQHCDENQRRCCE